MQSGAREEAIGVAGTLAGVGEGPSPEWMDAGERNEAAAALLGVTGTSADPLSLPLPRERGMARGGEGGGAGSCMHRHQPSPLLMGTTVRGRGGMNPVRWVGGRAMGGRACTATEARASAACAARVDEVGREEKEEKLES